ncbi:MAG: hypothetical protein V4616_06070, partial [Bacteroidota bacterium]
MIKVTPSVTPKFLCIIAALFICCFQNTFAQDAYTGKDFWLGFMSNNGSAGTMELHISAATATTVTLTIPNANPVWTTTVNVAANVI